MRKWKHIRFHFPFVYHKFPENFFSKVEHHSHSHNHHRRRHSHRTHSSRHRPVVVQVEADRSHLPPENSAKNDTDDQLKHVVANPMPRASRHLSEAEKARARAKMKRLRAKNKTRAAAIYTLFSICISFTIVVFAVVWYRSTEDERLLSNRAIFSLGNDVTLEMAPIPAGSFVMGSPEGEAGRDLDEAQYTVTISKPFMLGKYEVTQAQWEVVMGENPSYRKGADLPVECVSWNDCQTFVQKLNSLTKKERPAGYVFALPTEAQWEYACRAGSTTMYAFVNGTDSLEDYAWLNDNEMHPVGQKKANAWGLYDMHGNVWEWCADFYGKYPSPAATDPTGVMKSYHRVVRGGGWFSYAGNCRSAYRAKEDALFRSNSYGLRIALRTVIDERRNAAPVSFFAGERKFGNETEEE